MSRTIALINGSVVVGNGCANVNLLLSEGKIQSILDPKDNIDANEIINCQNMIIAPGLIDLHIHGGGGGFSQNYDISEYQKITESQLKTGTTSIVLTYMGANDSELSQSAELIRRQNTSSIGANILGIHIEGPWISPKKIGYLSPDLFDFSCDLPHAENLVASCDGLLKIVTLAPELEGIHEIIKYLKNNKIVASCGHTEANYTSTTAAIDAGVMSFTHLWNMSGPVQSREPGVVGCAMQHDECYIELVADGFHVHPANIKNTIRCKPNDKVCLVTDAMVATSTDMKSFSFMGVDGIEVRNGRTYGPNGAIIGSVLTLNKAVKNVVEWTGLPLPIVINMASANPAKLLGMYPQKGLISTGADADIAIYNKNMECTMAIVSGEVKYKKYD